ncbi:MAG TPA: hypothetical protein VNK82_12905 [Terriglobales bacterium]|nr:hypothetical protein [Terriglobales bacterium]
MSKHHLRYAFIVCTLVLSVAVTLAAQQADQPSDKPAAKPTQAKATSPAPEEKTLVGCLTGPDASGAYTLTNPAGNKPVQLVSTEDLKAHVGHQVKVSGQWEEAAAAGGKAEKKWKADKVEMMSATCPTEKSQKK